MKDQNSRCFPWRPLLAELVGTALLVLVGLSLVIVMFGYGSPMTWVLPREELRRLLTGFLFGTTGALIALSPVGKESGAHINPAVTLGFWLMRKLDPGIAIAYVLAQLAGALIGAQKSKYELLARCLITFVAFIPFFAFKELERILGEDKMRTLFFRGRAATASDLAR